METMLNESDNICKSTDTRGELFAAPGVHCNVSTSAVQMALLADSPRQLLTWLCPCNFRLSVTLNVHYHLAFLGLLPV